MENKEIRFKKFETHFGGRRFIIEEDLPDIGWYLYVYDKSDSIDEYDFLQDTMQMAIEFAYEEFGVPMDSWRELKD